MAALPTSPPCKRSLEVLEGSCRKPSRDYPAKWGLLGVSTGADLLPAHTDPQATGFGENQKVASNASVSTEAISQGSSEDGIWLSQSASGMQVSSRGPSEHAVWPSPVPAGT